jgi:hypothetical protein
MVDRPVLYVSTADGATLPIVDVAHPAFEVRSTDQELAALADQYVHESAHRQQQMAPELAEALKRSRLGRGLMGASGGFLRGIDTYLLKIGPANLGSDAQPLDRAIAASFPALTTRLRLQDVAHLVAGGLRDALAATPGRPIALINIGGGVGADSWNALLLLREMDPGLVEHREAIIAVLDVDRTGPAFGARAVDVLQQAGAPLHSITVRFLHQAYDWSDAGRLAAIVKTLPANAVCAVSSEGALFEYGSDQAIVDNLRELRLAIPAPLIAVGSVTRDSPATRASQASTRFPTIPRSIEAFGDLASAAGWRIESAIARPFTYNVRLVRRD